MWQVNCYCKRDSTDTKCPLCEESEDRVCTGMCNSYQVHTERMGRDKDL